AGVLARSRSTPAAASFGPRAGTTLPSALTARRVGVVHIVDVDSGRARTLRPNGLVEEFASVSWSPSAERLVFAATVVRNDQDLYRMGADGTRVRAVTHDAVAEQAPATSPDGRPIAFVLRGDVYVTRIDGPQRRRITRPA